MNLITECRIVREPVGPEYDHLVGFLARLGNTFSLVLTRFSKKSASAAAVITRLHPYAVSSREVGSWPGTELLPPWTGTLHTFRADADALAILRTSARRLYAWHGPDLPDDLCFYRSDGSPLLVTTAHENESELHLTEVELRELRDLAPGLEITKAALN